MKKIKIKELSLEKFGKYGTYANMINPKACKIGEEPVEFFRDMVISSLGQACNVSFSVCRVLKRPMLVDRIEYHNNTSEGIMPLDGDTVLYFAPATPQDQIPYDSFEAFLIPKGTMVAIRPGVWHWAPLPVNTDCLSVMIVLPERTYANDCIFLNIPADKQSAIEK